MKCFLLSFLFGAMFGVSNASYQCKPYDPEPAHGVQIEKVQGMWYGLHFKAARNLGACDPIAFAFVVNLKLMDHNTIESRIAHRTQYNRQTCLTATEVNKITSNPAVWKWQQFLKHENRTLDFRVLATDYKNFLIRWTCTESDNYGKCVDFLVAAWGRKPTPFPLPIFKKVSKIVKDKLCLDVNTFFRDSFENVCPFPPSQVRNKRRY